jgi:hypothetical protein
MNRVVSRFAYRLLLRLHPAAFRNEFGAEMLCIFDQQDETAAYLFFDGIISLIRQRCRLQNDPGQLSITSGTVITGPGIGLVRLLQGGIACSVICFSLAQLLARHGPFGVSVTWSGRMSCYTLSLRAPSHAEVVLNDTP